MNERFKELYEQAHIERHQEYFSSVIDPTITSISVTRHFDLEKFAELIVRECVNMAESFQHQQYDFTGDLELHEFMKKHFGVEE